MLPWLVIITSDQVVLSPGYIPGKRRKFRNVSGEMGR